MVQLKELPEEKRKLYSYKAILIFIFIIGILVRLVKLTSYPQGFNVDEAFAGYEGYSILNYGIDSQGYHFPVYLVAWGSGMNALYSYLCIPFIKIFSLSPFATRLPQAFMGILTLFILYKLISKVTDNKNFIIISTFLLAISPWHIMMSRWGLESNLVVSFLLMGCYFWIVGLDNNKYFIISAVCYGLSLYCYATIWIVVPFILLFQILYSLYIKKLRFNKYLFISGICIFIIAIPLLLFLLVNYNVIPEIKTSFISIPKLICMRNNELATSFKEVGERIYYFLKFIITQNDGLGHSSLPLFGMYYLFSLPFILIGLVGMVLKVKQSIKLKIYTPFTFLLIQLIACLPIILFINVNTNKINCLHIPFIICCAYGVFLSGKFIKGCISKTAIVAYSLSFILFCGAYFNSSVPSWLFYNGYDSAVNYAMKIAEDKKTIYIESINYPNVLYSSRTPVGTFVDTVEYKNYPAMFLEAKSFANFSFEVDYANIRIDCIYVFKKENSDLKKILTEKNFNLEEKDEYIVAYY